MKYLATEQIPEWAVCYIEYGDSTGLTDEETQQVDEFLKSYGCPLVFDWGEQPSFTHHPAFGLPTDCIEAKVYKA